MTNVTPERRERAGGGDPFVGRRLRVCCAKQACRTCGLVSRAVPGPQEYRRTHLLSLIDSIRDKVISSGAMAKAELEHHCGALESHLTDPNTLLIDKLLIQCWGHKPH
jgi:hypothetical protein